MRVHATRIHAAFSTTGIHGAVCAMLVAACKHGAYAQCEPIEMQKLDGHIEYGSFHRVAISDGILIVGEPQARGPGCDDDYCGLAYVYALSGGEWIEVATLTAPQPAPESYFGNTVAAEAGAVYASDDFGIHMFEPIGGVWQHVSSVQPAGSDYAVDGRTMAVGMAADNDLRGSVRVFEEVGDGWTHVATLVASDGAAGDRLGSVVAISGDSIVASVSAQLGWAYVFERTGDTWAEVAKLTPSDGQMGRFGAALAIHEDTVLVGAPSAWKAYVFERSGGQWSEAAILAPAFESFEFGASVAIGPRVAVIGAPLDQDLGFRTGAAFLFQRRDGAWVEAAKMTASDGGQETNERFGVDVALDGDTAAIGSEASAGDQEHAGCVYLFEFPCACPPDFNDDGAVDIRDFIGFLNAWADGDAAGDFNGDGIVDTRDVLAYLDEWVVGC